MHRPYALTRGDTIGIVAPSSPVPEEDLEKGIGLLEARGYQVRVGSHVLDRAGHCDYLAGTDEQRAADLNAMLTDPEIDAVYCARGGYGALRLLDLLDWQTIAETPKLFIGYSDITALHSALSRLGWVTFHATMVSSLWKLDSAAQEQHWRLIETQEIGTLPADPERMQTVVGGVADGELAGGNLCLLAHACGSRYAPDLAGKIVLIEDVNGAIYQADRDLTQLRNAGLLDRAEGFVIGSLTGWEKHESDPPCNTPLALWTEFFGRLGKPSICGFPFGHEPNPLAVPLGVHARLDAGARTLTLLEPATVPRSAGP